MTGSGSYRACFWCEIKGVYNCYLNKVIYTGNRRFLETNDDMRADSNTFPDMYAESQPPTKARVFEEDKEYHAAYNNAFNKSQARNIAVTTGCHGMYSLAHKLPGFNRIKETMPDAMHTISVQVKHIIHLLIGKDPEDSIGVRNAEKKFDRFPGCWVNCEGGVSIT